MPLPIPLARRFLASDRLPVVIQWSLAVTTPIVFLSTTLIGHATVPDSEYRFWLAVMTVLLFLTGWFAAIVTSWLILGPVLHAQGRSNGGPFEVGDQVQIISGPYRETVTHVYAKWHHATNRVELGEDARQQHRDIYADYQLLKLPPESEFETTPDAST